MPSETLEIVASPELEKAIVASGITLDGIQTLRSAFAPHFAKFHELAASAQFIASNQPKAAREMRLALKAVRIAAEKTRKELKEDSLRRGKAIDGVNAVLEYQLVPIESAMDEIEKAEIIAEENRIAALKAARAEELRPYADPEFYDLGKMPEDQWNHLLAGAKTAHEAARAALAQAEAQRVAKEKADAEERERQRLENIRLKEEADAREKVLAAEREAAAKAKRDADAALAAQKAEAEEAARKERLREQAAREVERQKAEAVRRDAEAKAKLERDAREKAEAELRAAQAAEAKRIADEAAAKKKAEAAPDREKLMAFAAAIRAIALPSLSKDAQAIQTEVHTQAGKFAAWVEKRADML